MQHIYGFNALRAFSVTLVILSHIGIMGAAQHPAWKNFFSVFNASYGVKTFFVLSGFLITTLLIREHDASGRINIFAFMKRRALRILPLYFLIVAIVLVLINQGIAQDKLTAVIYATFFAYNFVPRAEAVNYMSHMWSLAVEEQFYLVWPFVFALLFTRKPVLVIFAGLIVLLCWWRLATGYEGAADTHSPWFWTIPAIYPIMIGCIFALVTDCLRTVMKSVPALVIAIGLISIPLWTTWSSSLEIAGTTGIALLIAWIFLNQHRAWVKKLDWGPIGYFGLISYGLYMWQGVLTGNGSYRYPGYESFPLNVYLGVALTVPIAMMSYHFFEDPIRRGKWPSFRKRQTATIEAPASATGMPPKSTDRQTLTS
ncbi:acyltransferase family protein [Aliihoeflea sp. PC F10.4]